MRVKWKSWMAVPPYLAFAAFGAYQVAEAWPTRVIGFFWLLIPLGVAFYFEARSKR